MKVLVQTKLTPAITIYDSSARDDPNGSAIKKAATKFLDPVVAVTDDRGNVLYKSGDFYQSYFPVIAGAVLIGVAYIILRRIL